MEPLKDTTTLSTYEALAAEYYDPARHPTSANFRMASDLLLRSWLQTFSYTGGIFCEVGAGKSLLAPILDEQGLPLDALVLTDSSASMLAYSAPWAQRGARLVEAPAATIPLDAQSVALLVASLGDPYNDAAFWQEAARVLRPDGLLIFTAPAYAWAQAFRTRTADEQHGTARFDLAEGRSVHVPSLIYPPSEQRALIENAGLRVVELAHVTRSMLAGTSISPKLFFEAQDSEAHIVTGYRISKPAVAS